MHRYLLVLALLLPRSPASAQATHFLDASESEGVLFAHQDGPAGFAMGGGLAWLDADQDGDEDLFVTSSDGHHALYLRKVRGFTDASEGSGLHVSGSASTMGVIAADYDQDGRTDVYLTNNGPNQLFRNLGGGTFEEVAADLGVAGAAWSTSAAWADFDRDGDLDLYVGNYVGQINFPYHWGTPNQLFVNQGTSSEPVFVDMAPELGVDDVGVFGPAVQGFPEYVAPTGEATAGCTLSVCTSDWDQDGDPDLMVGNDFGLFVLPNRLYRNETLPGEPLAFTDVSASSGFALGKEYNMGINGADYDHDGDWDYYQSNLGDNLLLRNDGGSFTDVAHAAGPVEGVNDEGTLLLTSWGTVWGDFDNDGWEDLFVVNGFIPAADFIDNDERSPNHLWMNRGDGAFSRVDPPSSGLDDQGVGRGVGACDVDGDGWLDLYVVNNGGKAVAASEDRCRLFLNQRTLGDPQNGWLVLDAHARKGPWEAFGLRVEAQAGDLLLKRELLGDPVYVSSGSRKLHFGLGMEPRVDRLRFFWPSGRTSEWVRVPVRRSMRAIEPLVTVVSVGEASYAPGRLELRFTLLHEGQGAAPVAGHLQVLRGERLLTVQPWSASAPERVPLEVVVAVPLAEAAHAKLAGTPLEVAIYASSEGALDSRLVGFDLP